MKKHFTHRNIAMLIRIAAIGGLTQLSISVSPALAATLSRSADVNATVSAVWTMIGPFCAIKDWLPPVGTCTETASSPAERTLVTKDGKATFIETQTARNEARAQLFLHVQIEPLAGDGLQVNPQGRRQARRGFYRDLEQHLCSRRGQGTGRTQRIDRHLRFRTRFDQGQVFEIDSKHRPYSLAARRASSPRRRRGGGSISAVLSAGCRIQPSRAGRAILYKSDPKEMRMSIYNTRPLQS